MVARADCPIGTYSAATGQSSSVACLNCPAGTSTAATGAPAITSCLCNPGFVGVITSPASGCTGRWLDHAYTGPFAATHPRNPLTLRPALVRSRCSMRKRLRRPRSLLRRHHVWRLHCRVQRRWLRLCPYVFPWSARHPGVLPPGHNSCPTNVLAPALSANQQGRNGRRGQHQHRVPRHRVRQRHLLRVRQPRHGHGPRGNHGRHLRQPGAVALLQFSLLLPLLHRTSSPAIRLFGV